MEAAARGPHPLHQQPRHAGAAPGARPPPGGPLRRRATTRTSELLITVGASEALDLALRATCDPGDEVILHEPSYVAYVPAIVFAGGVVRHVATRFEDDFALDPAAVEAAITPRTKALFLGYPSNPTGAVLPDDVQDALADIARRHDLLVYSDEIYDRLVYGDYRHERSAPARHARADDPAGWLLQGLRHDRLAGRLAWRPRPTSWRDGQGPPVRDHVGPDHRPGRRAGRAGGRGAGRRADGRRVRPAPADVRGRAERARASPTFEPRGAFYAFPRISRPACPTRRSPSGC